jgi:hypothetical protein
MTRIIPSHVWRFLNWSCAYPAAVLGRDRWQCLFLGRWYTRMPNP